MATKKKTFYEILEVPSNATYAEIKAAYQKLSDKLHSERTESNREDIDFKLNVLNFAYHTLSVPLSRDAYDAQIAPPAEGTATSMTITVQPTDDLALKAEALLLRADAAALRADALLLRSDATSLRVNPTALRVQTVPDEEANGLQSALQTVSAMFVSMGSPLKRVITFLGGVVAFLMVILVAIVLFANRHPFSTSSGMSKEEEKLYLQTYYQENGVRVASKLEADLLDAENKRKQEQLRAEEKEQRAKEELERKERQFADESRRMGERVSENLRRDEERERERNERKQQYAEEEKRRLAAQENARIERELDRYRRN